MFSYIFYIFFAIFGIMFVGGIIMAVVSAVKGGKNINTIQKHIGKTLEMSMQNKQEEFKNSQPKFCDYCGTLIESGSNECPACGAKKK